MKTQGSERTSEPVAPTTITATQLARSLSDVLNRVHYRGERFIVERNGETVATLEPPEPVRGMTLGEMIEVMRAAPQPDDGFWDDVEKINTSQPPAEFPEWPD